MRREREKLDSLDVEQGEDLYREGTHDKKKEDLRLATMPSEGAGATENQMRMRVYLDMARNGKSQVGGRSMEDHQFIRADNHKNETCS